GEPGVGKTRLAAELADVVRAAEGRILVGACRPDSPSPYEPFIEALAPALATAPTAWLDAQVSRHGAGLARLFPSLAGRLEHEAKDPEVKPRARLLGALSAAVTELGREPVLLVLEDLHWATPTTVVALDHLVRRSGQSHLLVVGTYCDTAVHPSHPFASFLDDPSAPRVERIVLRNLTSHEVAALLVDRAAVAGSPAAALSRALWTATEGNPLLVTEAVRDLVARGALTGGAVKAKAVDSVGIAHDMAGVVAHRLRRAPAGVKAAVEAAAVVGRTFTEADIALLCRRKDDGVHESLRKAVAVAVIVPADGDGNGNGDGRTGRYAFIHDTAREAVLDAMAPNRLVRLHHTMVEQLEGDADAAPGAAAVLVHHHAAASPVGRSPEAVRHARRAGEEAMELLAYEEAADYFGQGLAFLGMSGDSTTRIDLLLLLGDAYHRAGEESRARQSFLQAAAGAQSLTDGPRLGRAALGLGGVMGVWGDDGLLIKLLEEAIEANTGDPSLKAKLLARLAQARATFDTPDELKAQSDEAWELAWDSRDADTMGAVLRARHEALGAPDDLDDRVEMDGELFAMANNAGDPEMLLLAHGWRLVDLMEQGHLVDADRDRKLHAVLARKAGDTTNKRDAELWAGTWAMIEGRPRRATPHIDKALALGHRARDGGAASFYWLQQLALVDDWGSMDDVDELVEVFQDLVRSNDRGALWRSSLALLYLRAGRTDDATAELDDLLDDNAGYGAAIPPDRDWLPTMAAIVEVAAVLGDERAPEAARLLSPYSRRLIVVGPAVACRGAVARVIGMAAAVGGNWAGAERQFQAALGAHERINAAPLAARTRSDFGRALAAKKGGPLHRGRVQQTLAQTVEEADGLGMVRLAAETKAILAEFG
ncbi:MAG: ATP-binding protein, partial [Acidimicrobiales bacterium]